MVEVVKLSKKQYKKNGKEYVSYVLSVPKQFVQKLGWRGGNKIITDIIEYKGRKALVYYKLEE